MPYDRGVLRGKHHPRGKVLELDEALVEPVAVGMLGRQRSLYLLVVDDAP